MTEERWKDGPFPVVLLALTGVTGLVDAISFLGLGSIFTANMTGNVVLLGFALAGAPGVSISRSLTSLLAFLVGAALGGRLGESIAAASRRRWLVTGGISEAVLLLAAALASIGFDIGSASPPGRLYALIVLTAVTMGLRNATLRRLAVPDLMSTVLTVTLTAVAAESSVAGGNNPRIVRRIASVASMLVGAAIGTLLLRHGLALPLAVSGVCVLAATAAHGLFMAPDKTGRGPIPKCN
jgi:uncharacterized membrane protein YoaK (UPF0700 family)